MNVFEQGNNTIKPMFNNANLTAFWRISEDERL
jgi:hypothetical protein